MVMHRKDIEGSAAADVLDGSHKSPSGDLESPEIKALPQFWWASSFPSHPDLSADRWSIPVSPPQRPGVHCHVVDRLSLGALRTLLLRSLLCVEQHLNVALEPQYLIHLDAEAEIGWNVGVH